MVRLSITYRMAQLKQTYWLGCNVTVTTPKLCCARPLPLLRNPLRRLRKKASLRKSPLLGARCQRLRIFR